jgi:hypothetical protein
MAVKKDDLTRLMKYAESLGIKVHIKPDSRDGIGAEWDMDTQEICLYTHPKMTNHILVLNLLHELGHHLDWIYNNKKESQEEVKAQQMLGSSMFGDKSNIPKEYRKIIYESEKAGIAYMSLIHKELDLKISRWKVKLNQYMDMKEYESFYRTGKFLTGAQFSDIKRKKKKYFKDKYGK